MARGVLHRHAQQPGVVAVQHLQDHQGGEGPTAWGEEPCAVLKAEYSRPLFWACCEVRLLLCVQSTESPRKECCSLRPGALANLLPVPVRGEGTSTKSRSAAGGPGAPCTVWRASTEPSAAFASSVTFAGDVGTSQRIGVPPGLCLLVTTGWTPREWPSTMSSASLAAATILG